MTDHIKTLEGIRQRIVAYGARVAKKRSWRRSEKLMTIALCAREIEALDFAIKALKAFDIKVGDNAAKTTS